MAALTDAAPPSRRQQKHCWVPDAWSCPDPQRCVRCDCATASPSTPSVGIVNFILDNQAADLDGEDVQDGEEDDADKWLLVGCSRPYQYQPLVQCDEEKQKEMHIAHENEKNNDVLLLKKNIKALLSVDEDNRQQHQVKKPNETEKKGRCEADISSSEDSSIFSSSTSNSVSSDTYDSSSSSTRNSSDSSSTSSSSSDDSSSSITSSDSSISSESTFTESSDYDSRKKINNRSYCSPKKRHLGHNDKYLLPNVRSVYKITNDDDRREIPDTVKNASMTSETKEIETSDVISSRKNCKSCVQTALSVLNSMVIFSHNHPSENNVVEDPEDNIQDDGHKKCGIKDKKYYCTRKR